MELLFDICGQRNRAVRVNVQDKLGNTPLYLAAKAGCGSMIQLLLRKGADPNLLNAEGSTPLHECCLFYGHTYFMQFLATCRQVGQSLEATVNSRDKNGDTPLHLVVRRFLIECELEVRELLRLGADPNMANAKGWTIQHRIAAGIAFGERFVNHILNLCDEFGRTVQLDARDNEGNTPLHLTIDTWPYSEGVVEILLRRGADPTLVNARGETPLHLMCRGCEIEHMIISTNLSSEFFRVNEELSRHRIAIDALDNEGRTPLQWAVTGLMPNTVDVLLDRGADLSNFVFPTEDHFDKCLVYKNLVYERDKLEIAIGALTLVEHLEKRGYELDRSDAMTIMRVIDKLGLFRTFRWTVEPVTSLLDDEQFVEKAKKMTVKDDDSDSTTLYDLIRLPLKEAAKHAHGLLRIYNFISLVRDYVAVHTGTEDDRNCRSSRCRREKKTDINPRARDPSTRILLSKRGKIDDDISSSMQKTSRSSWTSPVHV
ncbi:unnamed protein product [Trichogramma brassicae]|uniref:PRANC domain-containing protein n=1 Tax=Trichogramma brassicae TaxID=86971 RepID=A0A6H5J3J1_9HYME|nr:unnamed protein product [Trichogramma brassicae]